MWVGLVPFHSRSTRVPGDLRPEFEPVQGKRGRDIQSRTGEQGSHRRPSRTPDRTSNTKLISLSRGEKVVTIYILRPPHGLTGSNPPRRRGTWLVSPDSLRLHVNRRSTFCARPPSWFGYKKRKWSVFPVPHRSSALVVCAGIRGHSFDVVPKKVLSPTGTVRIRGKVVNVRSWRTSQSGGLKCTPWVHTRVDGT